jgi:hypothetical protein
MRKRNNFLNYKINVSFSKMVECSYAESCYAHNAECCVLFVVMLSGITLNVIVLRVVRLNFVILNFVILSVVMLSVTMVSVLLAKQLIIFLFNYSCKKLYGKSPRKQVINN